MSTAGATITGKHFAKMLPRAMQFNGKIVLRYSEPGCRWFQLVPLQIDLVQKFPILLRHQREKTSEAFAEFAFLLFIGRFWKLLFKLFQGATPGSLFPVNIYNRSSQDPIKPGDGFLVGFRMPIGRQRFDQTLLHDILGQMMIAKATASKIDERLEILDDRIFNVGHTNQATASRRRLSI